MRSATSLPRPSGPVRRELFLGAFTMAMAVVGLASLAAVALSGNDGFSLRGGGDARSTTAPAPSLIAIGVGHASAPAETAYLQLLIGPGVYDGQIVVGGSSPGATPGAAEREAVEPLIQAIRTGGVADADLQVLVSPALSSGYFGPSNAQNGVRVDATIHAPTRDRINEIVNAAGQAAAANGQALLQVGVAYAVADCGVLEREARGRAIEDARSQAQQQAELLSRPLGPLLLSSDIAPAPVPETDTSAQAGCQAAAPAASGSSPFSNGITLPAFNPGATAEARSTVQMSLTFALPKT